MLAGCGGAGGSAFSPQPGLTPVPAGALASTRVTLGTTATTASLPVAAGIAGSITFPAVSTATTVDVSASAAAPPGVALQSRRGTRADFALDIYEYITLAPKTTVELPILPALGFTFPASVTVNGKSVFFAITDPAAQPGALAAFETEGPAKVVGQRATIGAVARPFVLQAGHRYTFVVYAMSVPSSVTTPTIYVANFLSASITTYHADGSVDLAPITNGLSEPQDVAVSAGGTIYVLDAADAAVVTFASDGTRGPPTISLPAGGRDMGVNYFGIDVAPDGTIIVPLSECGFGGCFPTILRFAPDGTPLAPFSVPPSVGITAEAVDSSGNIDIIADDGDQTYLTRYSPDGRAQTTVLSGLKNATAIAVDAAGRFFLVANQKIVSYNGDGSPRALSISPNFVPGAIAVDRAGKIYVVDPADDQIVSYNGDGSPAAPTITTGHAPGGIVVR